MGESVLMLRFLDVNEAIEGGVSESLRIRVKILLGRTVHF
jgi:hypothetical protein